MRYEYEALESNIDMVPSKSTRKSSRRSSILKPPKPRQPLQNLNSSSKESSPATTKIKRRVSFAEKKHVKEFCNSLEQGTVWDNTYEEHDLSNFKISTKNQEEHQVANFCKETIYSSTQENNVQFTCNEEIEKNLNIEDCSQNINLNKHVKCQNEMLLCTPLSVTFNDGSPQKDCIVQKFQQFNKPNVAMVEVRNEDTSMELTVAVPSVIQPVDNVETATCFVDDRTQRFDNISMEITAAVPNALYLLQSNDNKIIIFNDVSMDITELVEKRVHKSSNRTTVMQDILQHKCDTANQDEETKLLNVSMEMTEMIPVNVHSVTRSFETNGLNYDTAKNNSKKLRYDTDAYETSINHDETRIFNDEEMELTTAITASSEVLQTDPRIPVENTPYLQSKLDRTKICKNEEMEFTTAIIASSEVLQTDLQVPVENTAYLQSKHDRTKICNNEEMEFTTAITASSEVLQTDSRIPVENTPYLQSKLDRTKICNNEEMEFTTAITASSEVLQPDSQVPVENTAYLQSKLDRTKICNNEEMEFTTAITASSEVLQPDSQVPVENTAYLQSKLDRTKICNNEEMEFTTAITASSEVLQIDSQVPVENTPYLQPNLANSVLEIYRNGSANSISNRTTIFCNNSMTMTKVVSLLNTEDVMIDNASDKNNQESSKAMLFPNTSTEVTEAVVTSQPHSQTDDPIANSTKFRQSILSKSCENKDLVTNSSTYADKILKDSSNIENSLIEESTPVEVQSSASLKPSIALHELMQQHTCVSALKENNTEKAYAVFNSASNDSFSAVNSEINKTECLQNATSSSRRTYIIQPLNNDQTLTISNKENNKISEMNHETLFCTLNDKESSICNISNNPSNVQSGEDCDEEHVMEKYVTFHNEDLEDIDLIEPPMFVCLDDISSASTSMSVTCNQEVDMEMNCLSKNENTKSEDSSKFDVNYSNHNLEQDSEENVRKSDIFVIKCSRPNEQLEKSKLEQEDQEQTNKIQKFKLLDVRDTNTKIQVLECSSSIICDNEKLITSNGEKDPKDLCRDNSNLENQNMECSLSNIIPIYESTPKVDTENNDKLINIHVMEIDNQFYSNEQIKSTLEFDAACTEEHISNELDPFSSLMNELRVCAKSDDIIWELYHENIERNVFVIGFISCSLLVIIYVRDICDVTGDRYIKEVKVTSRLADNAGELIGIVHRIILEKVDVKQLLNLYKNREDILPMLDHIAKEVKLAMDFMFDVKRLNNINLMEITRDSISFVSRTKRMDIILKITICIKPFDRIESQDISVHCILGSVREEDVKMLITNIKKDHKFLRRYMNDVKDYIYLMEDCGGVIEKSN
ncbi:PREDICTED: uncharacterized protein LOC108579475 [Habropoda laboriosa]|uniref:uncharacterized protein LOC108579475 n=1 Tax=Habropoda laboriosa TaxID=597456 RepID=UPI00083DA4FA|nr:PREDICTED: uncharacterized protein LOC108579475 [Habropoda laboriosa]